MQQFSDDGRMFLGRGSAAAYTEFAADGEILCDVHFGAESVFGFGRTSSYRAFQGDWIGKPVTPPDIKLTDENIYVSWNGATDVMVWELQGAKFVSHEDQHFELVDSIQKRGSKRVSHFHMTKRTMPFSVLQPWIASAKY
jgi:hypothetical protein